MIGYLSGKIYRVGPVSVILDVNGVGYEVVCPKSTLATLKEGAFLNLEVHTHMSENALQLFGFLTAREKSVFRRLISVSGIGPKLGLIVISEMPLNDLYRAIVEKDADRLTCVSGIGKKTAERIVIELKDKFKDEMPFGAARLDGNLPANDSRINDVADALISLGYPAFQAKRIAGSLRVEPEDTVQTLIKRSLGNMG